MKYTLQYNKDDTVTVFDPHGDWIGVFRTTGHAYGFVTKVLRGELEE